MSVSTKMPEIKSMETAGDARVKPNLARAWFDTVLNPLIGGLRLEWDLVMKGDLTWRKGSRTFASLARVKDHVLQAACDNLDQFVSFYPEVKGLITSHDERFESLLQAVRSYYDDLVENPKLQVLADEAWPSKTEIPVDPNSVKYYAAEYIINNIGTLPSYYATSEGWNKRREDLLRVRALEGVRPAWRLVERACADYSASVGELLTSLTTIRNRLSELIDVPIAV